MPRRAWPLLLLVASAACTTTRYDTSGCDTRPGRSIASRSSGASAVRGPDVSVPEACWVLLESERLSPDSMNAELRAGSPLRRTDLAEFDRITQWLSECEGETCTRIFTLVTGSGYQLFVSGYPGPARVRHLYPPGAEVF